MIIAQPGLNVHFIPNTLTSLPYPVTIKDRCHGVCCRQAGESGRLGHKKHPGFLQGNTIGALFRYYGKPAGSNQAAPAALVNFRLLLLPSGPDKIHGMTPHGTQSSSPTDRASIPYPNAHCKLFFQTCHGDGSPDNILSVPATPAL